jgi:Transglutaminase-like superfamily
LLRVVVWIACAACAAPATVVHPTAEIPPERHTDQTRFYSIWLGGARIGTATEAEVWNPRGVHLRRTEAMSFLRGDAEVSLTTQIDIDADLQLVAHQVRWMENNNGVVRSADADTQLANGAVPAELVPMIVRRDGHFIGAVFLPARNFVGGHGRIDPVAPGRLVARLALDAGPLAEATIDQASDGMPARVVDGEGVIALRITADQARVPFAAADLIAATAVPIGGRHHAHHLMLDGHVVLPALPGQAATIERTGIAVELGAQLPGGLPADEVGPDRANEIRTLVAGVRSRITPDLGATISSSRDADAATAGDCTTFALAYAALASRRGIVTRVVTGLRVDSSQAGGDRLVRHRWAVSWTGRAWIAVDAAFGAVPAGGDLIGLAIHDADDAGLVSGEAALTQVHAASWN